MAWRSTPASGVISAVRPKHFVTTTDPTRPQSERVCVNTRMNYARKVLVSSVSSCRRGREGSNFLVLH